jgi:hypothetical protein
MQTYGGGIYNLTWALEGAEWPVSLITCFISREAAASTHCVEGWMGPRSRVGAVEKRKISCPCRKLNPGHQAPYLVAIQSYPGFHNNINNIYIL